MRKSHENLREVNRRSSLSSARAHTARSGKPDSSRRAPSAGPALVGEQRTEPTTRGLPCCRSADGPTRHGEIRVWHASANHSCQHPRTVVRTPTVIDHRRDNKPRPPGDRAKAVRLGAQILNVFMEPRRGASGEIEPIKCFRGQCSACSPRVTNGVRTPVLEREHCPPEGGAISTAAILARSNVETRSDRGARGCRVVSRRVVGVVQVVAFGDHRLLTNDANALHTSHAAPPHAKGVKRCLLTQSSQPRPATST